MNKYIMFALIGLAVVALSATGAMAYQGDFAEIGSRMWGEGRGFMAEHHEQMEEVMENNDFETWQSLMEEKHADRPNAYHNDDMLTEEHFADMMQMHKLMEAGDYEEAQALHEELGLSSHKGFGRHGMGEFDGIDCPYHTAE